MNNFKMFLLALALTAASTFAFTVTSPAKVGSTTALSSYYSPYRTGYGYGTRSYDRYPDRYGHYNRYGDDMYGDYYYSQRRMNTYRGDDFEKATITREPFYYDGRDNNYRSDYYGYGRGYGYGMGRYGYGGRYGRSYYQDGYDPSGRYPNERPRRYYGGYGRDRWGINNYNNGYDRYYDGYGSGYSRGYGRDRYYDGYGMNSYYNRYGGDYYY